MDTITLSFVTERLERLEAKCDHLTRQTLRWKKAGALAVFGIALLIVAGAQKGAEPKVIDAERYILRDKDGKVRMELAVDERKNVGLILLDQNGNKPLSLGVTADGRPAIALSRADGKRQVTLAFTPTGTAGLALYDENLVARARLVSTGNDTPTLEIRDQGNHIVFKAP